MITNYEIRNIKDEEVLVLNVDFSFEFGLFNNSSKLDINDKIKDFIEKLKLKKKYQKILIVSGGIIVASMVYINGNLKPLKTTNFLDNSITIQENDDGNFGDALNGVNNEDFFTAKNSSDGKKIENTVEKNDYIIQKQNEKNFAVEKKQVDNHVETKQVLDSENTGLQIDKDSSVQNKSTIQNKISVDTGVGDDKNSSAISNGSDRSDIVYVTVYRSNGKVEKLELEDYIVGVVASEIPASFNLEALKAQAVVARTYALKKISANQKLTDTVSTQSYIDVGQMHEKWGNSFDTYYNKIKKAVSSTSSLCITYNGKYIDALYHSTSNGYTEDASNVWKESYPYLKSVESSWDKNVSSYEKVVTKEYDWLLSILGIDIIDDINIVSRNQSGRVQEVKVGDKIFTGVEFRELLGLRSADFDIDMSDGVVTITTRGYGHGVGMSQYGANEMAKMGYSYDKIIKYYYSGVKIQNIIS